MYFPARIEAAARRATLGALLFWSLAYSACAATFAVSSPAQLTAALNRAQAGDTIALAAGTYHGNFVIARSGSAGSPIHLIGPAGAVLQGGSGYGLHLDHASHWIVDGFTVSHADKGVVLDGANHNILQNLSVHDIGAEGIHFRAFSSDNTLKNSHVYRTGVTAAGFGEGVYIGSAHSNWCSYTNCKPDNSDRNRIIANTIGPQVNAEGLDIKEGSSGGLVQGNRFDGSGISGEHFADSVIDVKGNRYTISGNTVVNHPGAADKNLVDGFQVHRAYTGWGNDNRFSANNITLNAAGYGINIQSGLSGNVVCLDNTVSHAGAGPANVVLADCP